MTVNVPTKTPRMRRQNYSQCRREKDAHDHGVAVRRSPVSKAHQNRGLHNIKMYLQSISKGIFVQNEPNSL